MCGVLDLAKIVYVNSEKWSNPVIEPKSAEFFMDTLQNPLIREDVARDSPDTLDSAFMLAKDSLTL